jgi:hypothetical protein
VSDRGRTPAQVISQCEAEHCAMLRLRSAGVAAACAAKVAHVATVRRPRCPAPPGAALDHPLFPSSGRKRPAGLASRVSAEATEVDGVDTEPNFCGAIAPRLTCTPCFSRQREQSGQQLSCGYRLPCPYRVIGPTRSRWRDIR